MSSKANDSQICGLEGIMTTLLTFLYISIKHGLNAYQIDQVEETNLETNIVFSH